MRDISEKGVMEVVERTVMGRTSLIVPYGLMVPRK